ncbi:hypothetical protein ACFL2Q_07335 [Thermodesulfobacteriota bacterium]
MSKNKLQEQHNRNTKGPSADQGLTRQENHSTVFYRCTCPECGEDALELCGLGVFFRSEFLGVTHENEFGCGHMELDGDYDWVIECGSCGYSVFDTEKVTVDSLLEWAATHGQAVRNLTFTCPVCGSQHLDEVEIGLRWNRSVRAVYETMENSETEAQAEVALSFERVTDYGKSVLYCCIRDHELTKEYGSPVQTPEELVDWLKAHQKANNK